MVFQAYNVTDDVPLSIGTTYRIPTTSNLKISQMGHLDALFTITGTKVVEVRIIAVIDNNIQLISGVADYSPAWVLIS